MLDLLDYSSLKIECAKLQEEIRKTQQEIQQLTEMRDRQESLVETEKQRAVSLAKSEFYSAQKAKAHIINELCARKLKDTEELINSFPDLETKEYAGKYEVRALEKALSEVYPREFCENYICTNVIKFPTESRAYTAYTSAERHIASLKQGHLAGSLFNGINKALQTVCRKDSAAGPVALGIIAIFILLLFLKPFAFLFLLVVSAVIAGIQGVYVRSIFRRLYSVKAFLNQTYDNDIFQQDKADIMDAVAEFINGVKDEYLKKLEANEFVMDKEKLAEIERQARANYEKLNMQVEGKKQLLENLRKDVEIKLQQLEQAEQERKTGASKTRERYLSTITWEHKWLDQILIDITPDFVVKGAKWQKCNSLYIARELTNLETFAQLAIYQSMLHMHPAFCSQIVLDYKYMGSNLVQFSKVNSSVFSLFVDREEIGKKLEAIKSDVRLRCTNILQSCSDIEAFNQLMATYDSPGESYVLVHIFGLETITADMLSLFKNGPKVGYFFKLYLTKEEMTELQKEFPFEDFGELSEITDLVLPRTSSQIERMLAPSA